MNRFKHQANSRSAGIAAVIVLGGLAAALSLPYVSTYSRAQADRLEAQADRGEADKVTAYRAALLLNGRDSELRDKLGREYIRRWQPEQAAALVKGECGQSCEMAGDAKQELGQKGQIATSGSEALIKAQEYYRRGMPQTALRTLENAPESALKQHLAARIYLDKPIDREISLRKAEEAASKGIAINPADIDLRQDMAEALEARGESQRAQSEREIIERLKSGRY